MIFDFLFYKLSFLIIEYIEFFKEIKTIASNGELSAAVFTFLVLIFFILIKINKIIEFFSSLKVKKIFSFLFKRHKKESLKCSIFKNKDDLNNLELNSSEFAINLEESEKNKIYILEKYITTIKKNIVFEKEIFLGENENFAAYLILKFSDFAFKKNLYILNKVFILDFSNTVSMNKKALKGLIIFINYVIKSVPNGGIKIKIILPQNKELKEEIRNNIDIVKQHYKLHDEEKKNKEYLISYVDLDR